MNFFVYLFGVNIVRLSTRNLLMQMCMYVSHFNLFIFLFLPVIVSEFLLSLLFSRFLFLFSGFFYYIFLFFFFCCYCYCQHLSLHVAVTVTVYLLHLEQQQSCLQALHRVPLSFLDSLSVIVCLCLSFHFFFCIF